MKRQGPVGQHYVTENTWNGSIRRKNKEAEKHLKK